MSDSPLVTWDERHIKALLGLRRYPASLIQSGNWKNWINKHGGKMQVIEYLRTALLSTTQKQLFELILAHPDASSIFYAGKLHLSQSPYFARLADLIEAIALLLNTWDSADNQAQTSKRNTPTNLPSALTPLIGIETSLATVVNSLRQPGVRLLTLTGPGGVGKTRLAMAAGAALLEDFADGVFFVPLETITDPSLLITQIVRSLDIETIRGKSKSLLDALKAYLREQHILLILDNFEQLIQSAEIAVDLLQSAPNLTILATSREALNIYGETRYVVRELTQPDPDSLPPLEELNQWPALDLFVQRVQARHPEFVINQTSLKTIAHICHRLDGLPLAIELAAAQVRLLAPGDELPQLEYELKTLKDSSPNRSARQKTLWDAIDWSYQLLPETERTIFRQLAVFGREWGLEAAQAVCQTDDLLTSLEDLVDKSLLRYVGQDKEGDARFQMLQPVREYALDRLTSSAETEPTRHSHAIYFLGMVQRAEQAMGGPGQLNWIYRIKQERENLHIALQWMWNAEETEMAFNLLGSVWRYYNIINIWDETKSWLDRTLARGANLKSKGKVKALWAAAWLANHYNDFGRAMILAEEGLALSREFGDQRLIGLLLQNVGDGLRQREEYDHALLLLEESLSIFRQMGDQEETAWALFHIAMTMMQRGERARAEKIAQDTLTIFRAIGHQWGTATTLWLVGVLALKDGNYTLAVEAATERLAISRMVGARQEISQSAYDLAFILWQQGKLDPVKAMIEESLALSREVGDRAGTARALHFLGRLALRNSELATAGEFFEQARSIFEQTGDLEPLAATMKDIEHLKAIEKSDPKS